MLSFVLCLLAIILLPWFRGGNLPIAETAFIIISAAALLIHPHKKNAHSTMLTRLTRLSWLAWLTWLLIQVLPMSTSLLQEVSPLSRQIWQSIEKQGLNAHYSISLVPMETARLLLVSCGLFCLWESLRLHLQNRKRKKVFLWCLVILGSSQAIYGILSLTTGWTWAWIEPDGFVHKHDAHGSFANRNHFAAYLTLCAVATLVLLLSIKDPPWNSIHRRLIHLIQSIAVPLRVSLLTMVIAVVLSRSRMGNTSLAAAMSVFAILWLLRSQSTRSFLKTALIFSSIAVVDIVLVSQHFGLQRVVERIENTKLETDTRSTARALSQRLISKAGIGGTGLGSYALVEDLARSSPRTPRYVHAHNDHQQFIIETGWIGYGLLINLVILHLLMAARTFSSKHTTQQAIAAGAFAVCAAALLHALFEFNFQIPAWRTTFVAWLALIASCQHGKVSKRLGVESQRIPS